MNQQVALLHECAERIEAVIISILATESGQSMADAEEHAARSNAPETARRSSNLATSIANQRIRTAQALSPSVMLVLVDATMESRDARAKHFDHDLFFDPAWSMLLDLYRSELRGERICVSSLCIGSGVPATTALRYLRVLESRGYVERTPDQSDKRRSFLALSPQTSENLAAYFGNVASRLGIHGR